MGWDPANGIQIPEEYGGGYLAYPEVSHMLHCVNFMRKSTWPGYYNKETEASVEWIDTERTIRLHKGSLVRTLPTFRY